MLNLLRLLCWDVGTVKQPSAAGVMCGPEEMVRPLVLQCCLLIHTVTFTGAFWVRVSVLCHPGLFWTRLGMQNKSLLQSVSISIETQRLARLLSMYETYNQELVSHHPESQAVWWKGTWTLKVIYLNPWTKPHIVPEMTQLTIFHSRNVYQTSKLRNGNIQSVKFSGCFQNVIPLLQLRIIV